MTFCYKTVLALPKHGCTQDFLPWNFLCQPYTLEYAFNKINWPASWWVLAPTWWWNITTYRVTEAWPALTHFLAPHIFLCQSYTTEIISSWIHLCPYVCVLALNRVWTHQAWISGEFTPYWVPEPIYREVNLFNCKYFLLYKADIGGYVKQKKG